MSIDLRAPTESDLDRDRNLADYRKALHRGEDVSVEEAADKIPIYELGKASPVGYATVALPPAPQVTQQVVPTPNLKFPPHPVMPISGVYFCSGVIPSPFSQTPWNEATENEEQKKERLNNMGNKVLRHVNAHETERLGELSQGIREKMDYLKKNTSFTNDQWKAFAELNQQLDEMIGDPYDPESTESD